MSKEKKPPIEEILEVLLTEDAYKYFTERLMVLRPDLY